MKRFDLNLRVLLLRFVHGKVSQGRFVMMNLDELDPLPLGPGWFDSSWELESGLEVSEAAVQDPQFEGWFVASSQRAINPEPAQCLNLEATAPPRPAARAGAQPGPDAIGRTDNLIEFDLTEAGSWSLPTRHEVAPRELVALELTLA